MLIFSISMRVTCLCNSNRNYWGPKIHIVCSGFSCDNKTRCIPNDWNCDGYIDCLVCILIVLFQHFENEFLCWCDAICSDRIKVMNPTVRNAVMIPFTAAKTDVWALSMSAMVRNHYLLCLLQKCNFNYYRISLYSLKFVIVWRHVSWHDLALDS